MPGPFQRPDRRRNESGHSSGYGGVCGFWPKPNHFHAEPSMIGHDSVRSCLDFCLLCPRQWTNSHLEPKQGNDGQDGRIAKGGVHCTVSGFPNDSGSQWTLGYTCTAVVHLLQNAFCLDQIPLPPPGKGSYNANICVLYLSILCQYFGCVRCCYRGFSVLFCFQFSKVL